MASYNIAHISITQWHSICFSIHFFPEEHIYPTQISISKLRAKVPQAKSQRLPPWASSQQAYPLGAFNARSSSKRLRLPDLCWSTKKKGHCVCDSLRHILTMLSMDLRPMLHLYPSQTTEKNKAWKYYKQAYIVLLFGSIGTFIQKPFIPITIRAQIVHGTTGLRAMTSGSGQ